MESTLENAVRALAGVCDGASSYNGAGYNKIDVPLGHKLASMPFEQWTPRQQRAAWRMIAKYRGQLSLFGVDYDAIPEPPAISADTPKPTRLIVLNAAGDFELRFDFDWSVVNAVKALPVRRFNPDSKVWTVKATADAIESMLKMAVANDFEFADKVVTRAQEIVNGYSERIQESKAATADFSVSGLGGTLRPFQSVGVKYALSAKRCFIADEMGLGKTVEAIATIHAANAYPAIIVCPASLKLNWRNEIKTWLPGKSVSVWNGKAGESADLIVLNYDVLHKHVAALRSMNPQAIVYDESHYAKNYKSRRTVSCKELSKDIPIRLCLTGTPVLNRPQELLSQLGILGRLDDLGGFWTFAKRYCQAYQGRWGWDFSGAAHLDELNQKMRGQGIYIRRNKADVLKELPAKQRASVPVEISNRKEYDAAERDLISWLRERAANDKTFLASIKHLPKAEQQQLRDERANDAVHKAQQAEQLVRIEALKQLCAAGKIDAAIEWIESFIDTGEKLVIFAHHQNIVGAIADKFNAPSITGQTPVEKRQQYVDRFQNDPDCKIIVLNIQAGGVGLTLTAASNVAFLELPWRPGDLDQAEDRCHRIGQTDTVTAWYLLGERTIDEYISNLIAQKRQVVDAATDGGKVHDISIMNELVEMLTK